MLTSSNFTINHKSKYKSIGMINVLFVKRLQKNWRYSYELNRITAILTICDFVLFEACRSLDASRNGKKCS